MDPAQRCAFIVGRCILTVTNAEVDALNEIVQEKIGSVGGVQQEERVYLSADQAGADDDMAHLYPDEFLNSQTPSGMAPHRLVLRVGSPIMLLRNLSSGLANGTRLIVKELQPHVIDAEVSTGPCNVM